MSAAGPHLSVHVRQRPAPKHEGPGVYVERTVHGMGGVDLVYYGPGIACGQQTMPCG